MQQTITIRTEQPNDYETVETLTRKAFWNLYVPGCHEHYLAHIIRNHEDFLPELDLVLELDGQIIGNIMYTKSRLVDPDGEEKTILTFGPVSIDPQYQRMGYGKQLMEASFQKAAELGFEAIVIFGSPDNYVSRGFKSCLKYHISLEDHTYPAAMLVKELKPDALDNKNWVYFKSPAFDFDPEDAEQFDANLEHWEKKWQSSQESFYIISRSLLQNPE